MARNNSNKKSTNGNTKIPVLSQLEKRLLLAEARNGLGPMPQNGKQRQRRNGNGGRQTAAGVAYASTQIGKSPNVRQNSSNCCRIRHSELISSPAGTVAFTATSFALNPGIAATFPWLSVIAQNWEEYKFHALRFRYVTRTSTATPGSFMMAADYDAADAAPATEQIMSSYESCVEDAPWKDIICPLKAQSLQGMTPRHYIRTGVLANNLDIKTYDCGNFFSASVDGTVVPWGKLWVDYDVEFFIPQLPAVGGVSVNGGSFASGGTMSGANPLGSVPTSDAQNVGITVDAGSVVTFANIGDYVITGQFAGTTFSAGTFTALTGCAVNASNFTFPTAATTINFLGEINVTAPGATLDISVTAASVTSGFYDVGQCPVNSFQ